MRDKNPFLQYVGYIIAGGIAIGLAVGIASILIGFAAGVMKSFSAAPMSALLSTWEIPALSITLIGVGSVHTLKVMTKVVVEAEKKPLEWLLPILSVITGFIIDLCKEYYPNQDTFTRIIVAVMASATFLAGGIFWRKKDNQIVYKFIGSLCFIAFPSYVFVSSMIKKKPNPAIFFSHIPVYTLFSLLFMVLLIVAVGFMSWKESKQ